MSIFHESLRISTETQQSILISLDSAVPGGAVSLYQDEPELIWSIDIVDPKHPALAGIDIERAEEIAFQASQLFLYAFENAPDSFVGEWATEAGESSAEAIARVKWIREMMPNLGKLWKEKSHSIIPQLTSIRTESHVVGSGMQRVLLSLTSASNRHGRRISGTSSAVTVDLWVGDARRLIKSLQAALAENVE